MKVIKMINEYNIKFADIFMLALISPVLQLSSVHRVQDTSPLHLSYSSSERSVVQPRKIIPSKI